MEGYINNSKDVGFSVIIEEKFEGNMMYSPEIVPKKEDSDGVRVLKKIEDIEKEEKKKRVTFKGYPIRWTLKKSAACRVHFKIVDTLSFPITAV